MNKKTRKAQHAKKIENSDPRFSGYEIKPVSVGGKETLCAVFDRAKKNPGTGATMTIEMTAKQLRKLVASQGEGPSREKDALKNLERAEAAAQRKGLSAEFSHSRSTDKVRKREAEEFVSGPSIYRRSRVGHSSFKK